MRIRLLSALPLMLAMSTEAQACVATPGYAIIHSALPEVLPEDVIVAEIEIEPPETGDIYSSGLRAHVRKVIAGGPVSAVKLIVPDPTSCDALFANGRSGLFMGIPKQVVGDELIVWPILVDRYDGFRLPNGYNKYWEKRAYGPLTSD